MNKGVILLSRDQALVFQLEEELRGGHEVNCLDTLDHLADQFPSIGAQTILVHLNATILGDMRAGEFAAKLNDLVHDASIVTLVEEDCPPKLRELMEKTADHMFDMPADWGELHTVLGADLDPEEELAGLWIGLPHKELHGVSRSLVTFTPEMFEMMDEVKVAAKHNVTILLVGETGCGKTHLARLIHEMSRCQNEKLCTVACGALPSDLIESELFGYVKGAFTGADRDKEGKFAAAGCGTLLLDEIDVLSLDQQAKLLRVIETGEFDPVGSNDTQMSQARLIVASNYNLEDLVHQGTFRIDLYYRLNILKFRLLPLRQRPWDIEYLARKFALEHSRTHNIPLREIDPSFLDALRQYHWPGNIREMENVIRRGVLYCQGGILTVRDLPANLRSVTRSENSIGRDTIMKLNHSNFEPSPLEDNPTPGFVKSSVAMGQPQLVAQSSNEAPVMIAEEVSSGKSKTLEARVDLIERRIIEDCLRRNNHRRKETAAELGISRVTLYNKMKKFGLMG